MINGIKVGRFGFFRDADLTLRIDESNLYDQMDANGWVSIWFGGTDIYLPEYGDFSVILSCGVTFFWDVLDKEGNRTKDGFTEMLIPYNIHMESHHGDIIPLNTIDVFGEKTITPKMICSNLWFYTNLFRDQYFRYNLIVLNSATSSGWPDEANSKIVPMNENVVLESGDYIVGYRPKPEYMNQLAVVKKIMSGKDNAILFKFKVDLDYLADNPEEERILKLFSMSDDVSEFLVYPNQVDNINWGTHKVPYMDEYNRYLLYHGIEMYSPSDNELRWAHELYEEFMYISNRILIMDPYNEAKVIHDIDRIMGGERDIRLVGFSYSVIPKFLEWVAENSTIKIPTDTMGILKRVVLSTKYFKGFSKIDAIMGDMITSIADSSGSPSVHDGNIEVVDGQRIIANGGENSTYVQPTGLVNIVMKDGVRMFSDGRIPDSAKGYRYPSQESSYRYAGDIGNGLYKIMIAGQECEVFCDMNDYFIPGKEEIVLQTTTGPGVPSYHYRENIVESLNSENLFIDIETHVVYGTDRVCVYRMDGTLFGEYAGDTNIQIRNFNERRARIVEIGDGSYYGVNWFKVKVFSVIPDFHETGGWMFLMVSGMDNEYMTQFCDLSVIESTRYDDEIYGVGWGKNDGNDYNIQFYNLPFSNVKAQLSGDHDNPVSGTGYLEIHTGANGNIVSFTDSDKSGSLGQDLIVGDVTTLAGDKTDLTNFQIEHRGTNDGMNNLVVKMRGDSDAPYCRRYIKMLCVR